VRDETRKAIEGKFDYYLKYRDRRTGRTSAQHTAESLREIGIKNLTDDVLKAYLFSGFSAICYDITAVIEARGIPRRDTLELWKNFCKDNQQKIDNWIEQAKQPQ
jgi:hypothetical protein